jgi:hypothetical protein
MNSNSVNQKLADLHAHRVATMKPEDLAYNINQRQWLVQHADRSDHLHPGITAAGASLVAISPQVPQRLREIKERHHLGFPVASDTGNALGQKFGIVFTASAESQARVLAQGVNMPDIIGTGTWDLPMPAAIVIDRNRVVRSPPSARIGWSAPRS